MATCQICQLSGLEWSENPNSQGKHYLFSETGPHICKPTNLKPNPVPRYENFGGIPCYRGAYVIGKAITDEIQRCGLNQTKVKLEERDDFIFIH